ncbi:MAG: ubiquinol-cytochrome c reductase iron-sulfur subunit [Candidatus Kapaibacterium sp.]
MDFSRLNRRRLLRSLATLAAAAPFGWIASRQLFPWWFGRPAPAVTVTLGPVDTVFATSDMVATSVTGVPTMLVRNGARVEALSMLCTHGRCTVMFEPTRSCFVCPCHGGEFEKDGRVKNGPPTKALERLAVVVKEDIVTLTDRVLPPP